MLGNIVLAQAVPVMDQQVMVLGPLTRFMIIVIQQRLVPITIQRAIIQLVAIANVLLALAVTAATTDPQVMYAIAVPKQTTVVLGVLVAEQM